jgi:hypothetical protein
MNPRIIPPVLPVMIVCDANHDSTKPHAKCVLCHHSAPESVLEGLGPSKHRWELYILQSDAKGEKAQEGKHRGRREGSASAPATLRA